MLRNRVVFAAVLALAVASSAAAQSSGTTSTQTTGTTKSGAQTTSGTASGDEQTRPATTTFMGDTGLWYVPTGEVLPRKKWSMSAYRVNFDDNQGFTDVSNWPLDLRVTVSATRPRSSAPGSW